MSVTVDEILGARPSLRDRAKFAAAAKKAAADEEKRQEREELMRHAVEFMIGTLGVLEGDAREVEFRLASYSAVREAVVFVVEDLTFRARFEAKKIMERKTEFGADVIYDLTPVYEIQKGATSWRTVTCLADVGEAL